LAFEDVTSYRIFGENDTGDTGISPRPILQVVTWRIFAYFWSCRQLVILTQLFLILVLPVLIYRINTKFYIRLFDLSCGAGILW
jgi:hypothetical protein